MSNELTLILELLGMASIIFGAAWIVASKIAQGSAETKALKTAVEGLTRSVNRLDERLDDHGERIIHLEAKQGN